MNFEPFQRTDIGMQPLGPINYMGSNTIAYSYYYEDKELLFLQQGFCGRVRWPHLSPPLESHTENSAGGRTD